MREANTGSSISRKWKILLGVFVAAMIGGAVGMWKYNEKTPTAAQASADISVDALSLFAAFNTDEAKANKEFVDKVVQVSGTVRDIVCTKEGPVNVTLETGDIMGGVVCEFVPADAPKWAVGDTVLLKGFCAGYNLDVLLQRCSAMAQ